MSVEGSVEGSVENSVEISVDIRCTEPDQEVSGKFPRNFLKKILPFSVISGQPSVDNPIMDLSEREREI
jgi:hypothetical protein